MRRRAFSRAFATACDGALDFVVLAFAAWTLVYGTCLLAGISTAWATLAEALLLPPCAWLALRSRPSSPAHHALPSRRPPAAVVLRHANTVAALAAATVAALAPTSWVPVWVLWLIAAGAALACMTLRRGAGASAPAQHDEGRGAVAAAVWAVALGALSLLLVYPSPDDTQYAHLAAWTTEHGRFPVQDTLFSDEVFDAVFFPPWTSLEALAGTVARAAGVQSARVLYLGVAPLATVLSVLALWRLLRRWQVPLPAVALSTSLVFLLTAALDDHHTVGKFFVTGLWHGKAVFVAVLVPLLFVFLHEYAQRPTRWLLVLLAASGVAAVGLTTTGIFVVPVIAAGCSLPLVRRAPRKAAAAFAAVTAYPAFAAVVTLIVGMRNADANNEEQVLAWMLARESTGTGVLAFVIVVGVLLGPALLRSAPAGSMTACVALLVGALLSPGMPSVIMALTGLGEVLWRLVWALPIAALVGAAATGLVPTEFRIPLRVLPAAATCAGLLAWGSVAGFPEPIRLSSSPALERSPHGLAVARAILARARAGDLVLAPQGVSQTLLILSAKVTTVDPRDFYVRALGRIPGQAWAARPRLRMLLQSFVDPWLARRSGRPAPPPGLVPDALWVLDVDLACVWKGRSAALEVLRRAGYEPAFDAEGLTCTRPS